MILHTKVLAMVSTPSERVTVTMPGSLVAEIDRYERNRSRFIAEAVRHELARRRREELLLSIEHPYPGSLADAQLGLSGWDEALPPAEPELLDSAAGVPIRWSDEQGWQENTA
jgi:hypothetical protein